MLAYRKGFVVDDDENEAYTIRSTKANWADVATALLQIPSGLFDGVLSAVGDLQVIMGGHANHLHDREEFRQGAGREIEALTEGKDG